MSEDGPVYQKVAETKWKLVWRSNDAMGHCLAFPLAARSLTPLFIVALQRGRTEEQESLKRLSRRDPKQQTRILLAPQRSFVRRKS